MHSRVRKKGRSRKGHRKDADEDANDMKRKIVSLEKETDRMKKEIKELREHSLRQRADFENYQKQLERDKEEFIKYASGKLITQLLDVIDNLERAICELRKNAPGSVQGIEIVYRQFMQILEKYGLKRIEAVGKKFDPYYHEAFLQEESNRPDGTILEELQRGYMLGSKVIRHSRVKLAKPPSKSTHSEHSHLSGKT